MSPCSGPEDRSPLGHGIENWTVPSGLIRLDALSFSLLFELFHLLIHFPFGQRLQPFNWQQSVRYRLLAVSTSIDLHVSWWQRAQDTKTMDSSFIPTQDWNYERALTEKCYERYNLKLRWLFLAWKKRIRSFATLVVLLVLSPTQRLGIDSSSYDAHTQMDDSTPLRSLPLKLRLSSPSDVS